MPSPWRMRLGSVKWEFRVGGQQHQGGAAHDRRVKVSALRHIGAVIRLQPAQRPFVFGGDPALGDDPGAVEIGVGGGEDEIAAADFGDPVGNTIAPVGVADEPLDGQAVVVREVKVAGGFDRLREHADGGALIDRDHVLGQAGVRVVGILLVDIDAADAVEGAFVVDECRSDSWDNRGGAGAVDGQRRIDPQRVGVAADRIERARRWRPGAARRRC